MWLGAWMEECGRGRRPLLLSCRTKDDLWEELLLTWDFSQPQEDHSSPASLCAQPITLSSSLLLFPSPPPPPFFFLFWVKIKRSRMLGEKKEPPVHLHLVNYKQGAGEGCTLLLTWAVWKGHLQGLSLPFATPSSPGPIKEEFWICSVFHFGPTGTSEGW